MIASTQSETKVLQCVWLRCVYIMSIYPRATPMIRNLRQALCAGRGVNARLLIEMLQQY